MFLGHLGVALAAKPLAPRASLGTLVFAALWIDLLWPIFLLSGVESVRIEPGATAASPLVFEHYPWSHSLLAVLLWAAALGFLRFATRDVGSAIVVSALVISHWLLDAVVHVPDLPLMPGGAHVGAGLWNHPLIANGLEVAMLVIGATLYIRATKARDRIGNWTLWAFIVFVLAIQLGSAFGPPPPDVEAIQVVGLAQWLLVGWAVWIDRHRRPVRDLPPATLSLYR
ncbi:MAG: hypothetical protein WBA53_06035 [Burkholderiaceae bacterium]